MAKKKQIQIDWTRAPQWAQWFAVDFSGDAFFYHEKPILEPMIWRATTAIFKYAGKTSDWMHWQESLQERPKE